MALTLKVNFTKGWPSPYILEKVAAPAAAHVAGSANPLLGGHIAHLDNTGKWVLGVSAAGQLPFVVRNGVDEADSARSSTIATDYVQVSWGGIQGIAFSNPIEFQTVQFTGTPAIGTDLSSGTDGKLKAAVTGDVIIAQVSGTAAPYQGQSMLTVIPDNSRRVK